MTSACAVAAATIAVTLAACDAGSKVGTSRTGSSTAPTSPPAIEPQLVSRCVASYACGMAHPGLGSYSDVRAVDLATCLRTVAHDSDPSWPDSHEPPPGGTPPGEHTRNTETIAPERCAELAKLLGAITIADAAAANESAQVDTESCSLDVQCPAGAPSKLRVQRQTTNGASAVERLLRAL